MYNYAATSQPEPSHRRLQRDGAHLAAERRGNHSAQRTKWPISCNLIRFPDQERQVPVLLVGPMVVQKDASYHLRKILPVCLSLSLFLTFDLLMRYVPVGLCDPVEELGRVPGVPQLLQLGRRRQPRVTANLAVVPSSRSRLRGHP